MSAGGLLPLAAMPVFAIIDGIDVGMLWDSMLRDGLNDAFSGHAFGAIIVETDVAVLSAGILPGNHEYGEALLGEELDQGIRRRQVEDIVFHDGDEDRGMRPLERGRHNTDHLGK